MTTAAKPTSEQGSHYYKPDGSPAYEVVGANGAMRKTTISDARKLGLYPSVTTILGALNKPALTNWLIENACLAVLTTPRASSEELDKFVKRVLHEERVQDQESDAAKARGTEMHAALESACHLKEAPAPTAVWEWCEPAYREISQRGTVVAVEKCIVGEGYAGRVDLIQDQSGQLVIWDWKTTKKLPKAAYKEHAIQLSAYAAAIAKTTAQPIRTGNVYISTVEKGAFQICEHGDWRATYEQAFLPLFKVWQFVNSFNPLMHLN